MTTELHRVVAVLADRTTRVYATNPLSWGAAQGAWRTLDDQRVRGHMPHVAYYAVRSADDPDWQGLKLSAAVTIPHYHQPLPQKRPTAHQAGVLRSLVWMALAGQEVRHVGGSIIYGHPLRWVSERSCGGPQALRHLCLKGYATHEVRLGPRGGEHYYYQPTPAGVAYAARLAAREGGGVAMDGMIQITCVQTGDEAYAEDPAAAIVAARTLMDDAAGAAGIWGYRETLTVRFHVAGRLVRVATWGGLQ